MRCVCVVLLALATSRGIQLPSIDQTDRRQQLLQRLPKLPQLPRLPQLPKLSRLQERVRQVIEAPRNRWITAATEARTESGGDAVAFVGLLTGVDGWTLKFEKGNVRVWARQVTGSKFKEVRGNGIVEAPPAKVLAAVPDQRHRLSHCALQAATIRNPGANTPCGSGARAEAGNP